MLLNSFLFLVKAATILALPTLSDQTSQVQPNEIMPKLLPRSITSPFAPLISNSTVAYRDLPRMEEELAKHQLQAHLMQMSVNSTREQQQVDAVFSHILVGWEYVQALYRQSVQAGSLNNALRKQPGVLATIISLRKHLHTTSAELLSLQKQFKANDAIVGWIMRHQPATPLNFTTVITETISDNSTDVQPKNLQELLEVMEFQESARRVTQTALLGLLRKQDHVLLYGGDDLQISMVRKHYKGLIVFQQQNNMMSRRHNLNLRRLYWQNRSYTDNSTGVMEELARVTLWVDQNQVEADRLNTLAAAMS